MSRGLRSAGAALTALLIAGAVSSGCGGGGGGGGAVGGPAGDPAFAPAFYAADVRADAPLAAPSHASTPAIAAEGQTVHALFVGSDAISTESSPRYQRSIDGGQTWLATDVLLDTDPTNVDEDDPRSPRILVAGTNVWAFWIGYRNDQVRMNRSVDGGRTWLAADVRVDTQASGRCLEDLEVVLEGTVLHAVWRLDGCFAGGLGRVLYQRSADGGVTWLAADVPLSPVVANQYPERPCIRAQGSDVRVVWHDARNGGNDIWFRRSADGGATWDPEVRLDTDAAGAASSTYPALAHDGLNVYVAWHENRTGGWRPRFNRSTDGGATWLAADLAVSTPATTGGNADLDVACEGTTVHIVWTARPAGGEDVFYQRSIDGGLSWAAIDVRLDTDVAGAADSSYPRIALRGRNLHVLWADTRTGATLPRFQYSTDRGLTWAAADLTPATDPAATADTDMAFASDGTSVIVCWADGRTGDQAIQVNASYPAP